MPPIREQVHAYVTPELRKDLQRYASRRHCSESAVVHEALKRYLNDVTDSSLVLRRLDKLSREMSGIQRNLDVATETLAAFVQIYYAHTPSIPIKEKASARQEASVRFSGFIDHVSARLREGPSFIADVVKDEPVADPAELAAAVGTEP